MFLDLVPPLELGTGYRHNGCMGTGVPSHQTTRENSPEVLLEPHLEPERKKDT